MNGLSLPKVVLGIAIFLLALAASPIVFIYASSMWGLVCASTLAKDVEESFSAQMPIKEAIKKLEDLKAEIYEITADECDSHGSLAYPSHQSEGGPCIFAHLEEKSGMCTGNKVHARLFFDEDGVLVKWNASDANAYL